MNVVDSLKDHRVDPSDIATWLVLRFDDARVGDGYKFVLPPVGVYHMNKRVSVVSMDEYLWEVVFVRDDRTQGATALYDTLEDAVHAIQASYRFNKDKV